MAKKKKIDPKRWAKPVKKPTQSDNVFRLKITMNYIEPPIWREIETPDCTLETLHDIIQLSMPWEYSHMWDFAITRTERYGMEEDEYNNGPASEVLLSELAERKIKKFVYTYDFGDSWEHIITFETPLARDPNAKYPRCVAGERASPPEDCGGVPGYEELLEILADPKNPEYGERLEWLGDDYDPAAFDIDAVNAKLKRLTIK